MTTAETIHPETPTSDSPPLASIMDIPKSGHPRNGKIAKLPKELRALINQMLSEQVTSAVIIEQFAQHGISLNHENVSNWRNRWPSGLAPAPGLAGRNCRRARIGLRSLSQSKFKI